MQFQNRPSQKPEKKKAQYIRPSSGLRSMAVAEFDRCHINYRLRREGEIGESEAVLLGGRGRRKNKGESGKAIGTAEGQGTTGRRPKGKDSPSP